MSFSPEKARVYPNENFASYILGFARPDAKGNTEGKFGLEKVWINIYALQTEYRICRLTKRYSAYK